MDRVLAESDRHLRQFEDSSPMKNYEVTLPFVGQFTVNVTAENEETAKETAYEALEVVTIETGKGNYIEVEWDTSECIVDGNVRHFSTANEIAIKLSEDC